ncbi:MAG: VOC family protein [Rhodoferax sp.]|nr:VOC family protein [Rhodoferax sp.]
MKIDRIHHVAYRCKDAKETVLWYQKMLKMEFVLAIAEDLVPSTKAPDPYMHIFLDAGDGNVLAFFELPTQPPMGRDPNGHRLELACPDPAEEAMLKKLDAVKWDMLEEWSKTRRAPKHAAFLHEREFRS